MAVYLCARFSWGVSDCILGFPARKNIGAIGFEYKTQSFRGVKSGFMSKIKINGKIDLKFENLVFFGMKFNAAKYGGRLWGYPRFFRRFCCDYGGVVSGFGLRPDGDYRG